MAPEKKMFRAEAVEQLNSPEQLEQLLKVTDRRAWISLFTIAALLTAAIVWSILGQIPITVEGVGILVFPRRVVAFQAPAGGQIEELKVQVGSTVRKGDVLGTIAQPNLAAQLKGEIERLAELTMRNERVSDLSDRREKLEREANARQRATFESRIVSTQNAAEAQLQNSRVFIENQIKNIGDVLKTQRALEATYNERYRTLLKLKEEGASSNEAVLAAKQRLIDNRLKTSELKLKRQEIELSTLQAEDTYRTQMARVADLGATLQDLTIQESQRAQLALESESTRELQIQSIGNTISQLEKDLEVRGQIISEHDGRILELTMGEGQIVSSGRRLGSIEAKGSNNELLGLAYLRVGDGKKLKPGMDIRISPSTVQRERYGSIEAVVSEVTPFPVTSEAVASVVGSSELARELMQNTTKIQITSKLLLDSQSISGFKWTSGNGPPDVITAGTTAAIRATVEYRRPITFAIPILRKWTGV